MQMLLQPGIPKHWRCAVATATLNRIRHALHKHLPWQRVQRERSRRQDSISRGQLTALLQRRCHRFDPLSLISY